MFETAELGHTVSDEDFRREEAELREQLLDAQYRLLREHGFPCIIVIGGVDGAGKGETVNLINAWMDPRHIRTNAFGALTEEEAERPRLWRYWRDLPPKGKIGIFFGAWHSQPILDRVHGRSGDAELERAMGENLLFEQMLTDEGALILKFWFHLSKKAQRKRLKALEADPDTRWRVTDTDWEHFKLYDKFRRISATALELTSTGHAPWLVVDGSDANHRSLVVGRALLDALRRRLQGVRPPVTPMPALPPPAPDGVTLLTQLDHGQSMGKKDYAPALEKWQGHLNLLLRHRKFRRHAVIAVFEGMDAAGKGSSIRRVTGALDARQYSVVPIAAPTEEERAQPYLWRFWRHVPRHGRVAIFDRSWYGRVLVERVEQFCDEEDWMRAYAEINHFEAQLADAGAIIAKFWLNITPEEQLQRFRERQDTPFKQFKITPEDWRNRDKWAAYQQAACDMVERTSTEAAPWELVPANDKQWARIHILKTLCQRIEASL